MARRKKVTDEQIIDALHNNVGIYVYTADELGISRQAMTRRIKANEELTEAHESAREQFKDKAEYRLMELIEEKNLRAIIFYLKTQARDRGYGENPQAEQKATERQSYFINEKEEVF